MHLHLYFFYPQGLAQGVQIGLLIGSLPGDAGASRMIRRLHVSLGGEKAAIGYGMALRMEWEVKSSLQYSWGVSLCSLSLLVGSSGKWCLRLQAPSSQQERSG